MSAAETLRRAADRMRERAEAARAGRWTTAHSALQPDLRLVVAGWESEPRRVAACAGSLPEGNGANAAHIASWHPAVALTVADWLDYIAETCEDPYYRENLDDLVRPALAVARAYLGEVPDA